MGCKSDLRDNFVKRISCVSTKEGEYCSQRIRALAYFETSAKFYKKIDDLFAFAMEHDILQEDIDNQQHTFHNRSSRIESESGAPSEDDETDRAKASKLTLKLKGLGRRGVQVADVASSGLKKGIDGIAQAAGATQNRIIRLERRVRKKQCTFL